MRNSFFNTLQNFEIRVVWPRENYAVPVAKLRPLFSLEKLFTFGSEPTRKFIFVMGERTK